MYLNGLISPTQSWPATCEEYPVEESQAEILKITRRCGGSVAYTSRSYAKDNDDLWPHARKSDWVRVMVSYRRTCTIVVLVFCFSPLAVSKIL